ncbi:uncharacterized protein LOC129572290 [Sitodiplosis mosellana]|uniref:uncharacterized protein LOC129572290 n=1 Tax=Sitodiplosis mosellana TaxID=263140 RepID=UPI002444B26F|nr:uncharacterized protein LOC129572290 [Sitodiplosis mosellana]
MLFMKEECEMFANVEATAEYTRIINDIFDIMNSTKAEGGTGFKRAITKSTSHELFQRFDTAKNFIKQLTTEDGTSVFSASISTAFFGFFINMINFRKIYHEYVETDRMEALVTHRFSQDHLETFFGSIRSMGGFNDNPTAQQFEAAYRKLLIHNDVVCSEKANCIDRGVKILTVSSHKTRKQNNTYSSLDMSIAEILEDDLNAGQYVDDSHSHSLAYMASELEKKIINAKSPRMIVKCGDCINSFIENELMEDSFIRFKARRTNMMQPCRSTYEICKFIDHFLKCYEDKTITFRGATMKVLSALDFDSLYPYSNFQNHSEPGPHKYDFVKQIVELYIKLKSNHIAKCITTKSHDEASIRHFYKKLIHEAGQ